MMTISEFEQQARAFLDTHAQERADEGPLVWGEGSDDVSLQYGQPARTPEEEHALLEAARAWQALRYDNGFGWIQGPVAYGGGGLPQSYSQAFDRLEQEYDVASKVFFATSHGLVGTTILAAATEDVRQELLPPMYRGDIIGCQLFSEPSAGSDLASLSTSAIPDGDHWIVNGQKVWTSGAHHSDVGLLLARTDPTAAKNHGLTMFLVDMRDPGVEVRPLRQMTGGAHFNEVFLNDVRVEDRLRLGDVNTGWAVANETLAKERASVAPGGPNGTMGVSFERLALLAHHFGASENPCLRDRIAALYIQEMVMSLTATRLLARTPIGQPPGPEMSMCKLASTNHLQATSAFVSTVLGARLVADDGEWGTYAWSEYVLAIPGTRFGGGTDEIQKNILGERVLGLPREPRSAGDR